MMLTRAKALAGSILSQPIVGAAISRLYAGKIPFRGYVIDTRSPHISPQAVAALRCGFYEKAEIEFVRQYLPTDSDVVEFGSSLGVVTLEILAKQAAGRRLISVEANPHLIDTIRKNLASNNSRTDVEIVNAAIDYSGTASVEFGISSNNLVSSVERPDADRRQVPAITLAGVLAKFAITDYALVSDIEGAEARIIFEDSSALARCSHIIAELHTTEYRGSKLTAEDLATELRSRCGFRQIAVRGAVYAFAK